MNPPKDIIDFVEAVDAKQRDARADTSELEQEINRHVYALYGLTPEEIQIVEASSH